MSLQRLCWQRGLAAGWPTCCICCHDSCQLACRPALVRENIADTGRTVIASLHFPSFRLICNFHQCMLMKHGGTCVYFGPVGPGASAIRTFFDSIPGVPLCPPGVNPAAYAIELIGDGHRRRGRYSRNFEFEYHVSDLFVENERALEALRSPCGAGAGAGAGIGAGVGALTAEGATGAPLRATKYSAPLLVQLREVLLRQQRQHFRNVHYSLGRLLLMVFLSAFVGTTYWQINYLGRPGMNARAGEIFASCIFMAVANAQASVPQITAAKPAYMREQAVGMYSAFVYNLSWGLAEIPYLLVMTLVYCTISGSLSGLAVGSAAQFFQFWFIMFEFALVATFLGMLLAFAAPVPAMANIVVSIFISCSVPTSGLVIVKRSLHRAYLWIFWINPLQYALNALTSTAFFCDTNMRQCKDGGLNMACATNPAACPDCPCPRLSETNGFVWEAIRTNRSLDHSRVGLDMLALFLFTALFRILAGFALRYFKWNRRF